MSFNNINKFVQQLNNDLPKHINKALEAGKQSATNDVAVDTGELRASIQVIKVSDNLFKLSAGLGINDLRALINEFGSRFRAAKPYMSPAVKVILRSIEDIKVN